jgi:hypothetical protein
MSRQVSQSPFFERKKKRLNKFKVRDRLFLLAYEFDENELLLLSLGAHENSYRELKRYLA